MSPQKTILVTGGAGFIGSHLCARLIQEGHRVISLDNYFTGSRENHVEGVDYREGHTRDIEHLIPESPEIVYHLGEYSRVEQSVLEPELVYDFNVLGTKGVLEFWQKRGCKLIYAGSSTKFGDEGRARMTSPYASSKASNTEQVKNIGDTNKLPYAIPYFYNVYGQGERSGIYGTVIETFRQMYIQGAPLAVVAPGTQTRNFTHVEDIVDGLLLVGEKGLGDEYGLGNAREYSVLEVAGLFGGNTVMLPERASNRTNSSLDTSRAGALGWKPRRSLEEYIQAILTEHPHPPKREKRVLIFSTTFFPVEGPAERAMLEVITKIPDVQFDVITSRFTSQKEAVSLPNATIYHVGMGRSLDKYLLPLGGFLKAQALCRQHSYLFTWSLMASYGALVGIFLKWFKQTPLLVTLADQRVSEYGFLKRIFLWLILRGADQVYGVGASIIRSSLGVADAFANQLRYVYVDALSKQ